MFYHPIMGENQIILFHITSIIFPRTFCCIKINQGLKPLLPNCYGSKYKNCIINNKRVFFIDMANDYQDSLADKPNYLQRLILFLEINKQSLMIPLFFS